MRKIYLALLTFCISAISLAQGVTTASLGGQVTDTSGEPLPGASVVALHIPSGTTYGAATDFDGFYRISGMRIGGPYTITISYIGFEDFVKEGILLNLGGTQRIRAELGEASTALEEVVVTAQANNVFDSGKTGSGTNIDSRKVNSLPTVSRSIADFARLTPEAQIREDNEISISGQNNRYNAIYVDGAINNDVFGLAGSGTNGGQTGVNPISIDAIESFQVNVAPYDVTIGGFSGGAINAITRSGTNTFEGSAYFLYRNQDLAGKTPGVEDGADREKLPEFTAQTYGVRLGGPIVEDKVFFFLNYEHQDDETPQPFEGIYDGDSGLAGLEDFSNFLQNQYGYDPGGFTNNTRTLTSDKLLFKIDWNINESHKLSFRNNYVKANFFGIDRSTSNNIYFNNIGENFESIVNTASLELNSTFGSKYSNNLILGYTRVRDDRGISGAPFPAIEVVDGDARIFAGSDAFSTANLVDQDILTLTNNFRIYSGRHSITLGTHNEYSDITNLFFGRNFGEYTYTALEDFFDDDANEYRSSYSVLGGVGDNSVGSAEFNLLQLGFYVQDEVQFTDTFKFTMGVRFDFPIWDDGRTNDDFNTRAVTLLEAAGKDLEGGRVGEGPRTKAHFSPRAGFNWDLNGTGKTQIRGGLGVFTSRMPLVWPGGAYNNTGNNVANTRIFRPRDPDAPNTVPTFNPDVNTQFREDRVLQGNIDLLSDDLKLPQTFKASIGVDQRLPGGFVLSGEILSNTTITGLRLEDLNLAGRQFTTTGAGPRANFGNERIDDTYRAVHLISNTGEGKSWNASLSLSKNFYSPFLDVRAQATYSYGESQVLFEGTSSQIISNFAFMESVNGSNNLTLSTSDFDQGNRYLANVIADFKWSKNIRTTLGLFYEGADGTPFSFVVGGRDDLIDDTEESFVALPFIPSTFSEAQLVDDTDSDGNIIATAQEQWEAMDAFIEGNDYLRGRRGQFAERNGSRNKMSHVVDLKFAQDFAFNVGERKHTFQLTADIFNFTNLLNKDWGRRYFTSSFDTATLVNFEGFAADGTTPTYTYNSRVESGLDNIDDQGFQSSRWQAQLGIRYSF
ncbi:MAG: carboxypeptidase regulatory-like domain-containing protein [Bacteroidota bacterium]